MHPLFIILLSLYTFMSFGWLLATSAEYSSWDDSMSKSRKKAYKISTWLPDMLLKFFGKIKPKSLILFFIMKIVPVIIIIVAIAITFAFAPIWMTLFFILRISEWVKDTYGEWKFIQQSNKDEAERMKKIAELNKERG